MAVCLSPFASHALLLHDAVDMVASCTGDDGDYLMDINFSQDMDTSVIPDLDDFQYRFDGGAWDDFDAKQGWIDNRTYRLEIDGGWYYMALNEFKYAPVGERFRSVAGVPQADIAAKTITINV